MWCGVLFLYIRTVGLHAFHINNSVSQINLFIHTLFHKSTVFHTDKVPLGRGWKVQSIMTSKAYQELRLLSPFTICCEGFFVRD